MIDSVIWKIGGEAGFGIMSAGNMLARSFSRVGYHVLVLNEYPSLIRGGNNLITVRIATHEFHSMNKKVNILVGLNKQTIDLHKDELSENAIVVYDPKDYEWKISEFSKPVKLAPVPLTEIVKKRDGESVMRNTVALGVTVALLGADFSYLSSVIESQFKKKGKEVVDFNHSFALDGYEYIQKTYPDEKSTFLNPGKNTEKLVIMNASEAVGIGAVKGGMKFAAVYPMTPINSVITFLADHAQKLGIVYKQPEDEIAGINMALGASMAGVRSMVATSGGGFALMTEGLSLSGMLELPIVINLGMRVGPATGMPTWTEQGDLLFAIYAGHGEFARIILAPANATEAYFMTRDAFNLADKYQIPVFVLTDKYINECHWCVRVSDLKKDFAVNRGKLAKASDIPEDGSFKRYSLDTNDGVSLRSIPGMANGQYFANSYEHNEKGLVSEKADNRHAMASKRLKKFQAIKESIMPPIVYGSKTADITLITWGSSRGPVLEALESTQGKAGKSTFNVIHFPWLFPFPTEVAKELLASCKKFINVEQNATGQLATLIRANTGIEMHNSILKYDGRPFFPEEILEGVK